MVLSLEVFSLSVGISLNVLAQVAFLQPSRLPRSKTAMRVKVFDFPFLNSDQEQDPEEAGTRSARQAGETSRVVEVSMPLGMDFEERAGGDIYIKSVEKSSDAYAQGIRPGAQLVMISATFGDEMWNTRNVGLTQFFTVLNSRFGSTMKLALEKEDQNVLSAFMDAFARPSEEPDEKKQQDLEAEFDQEEEKLKNGGMWNPFR
ncbi:unnamed protein product [Effrenium voratum]|nr:unnamed protein product [Effrenium voratum]CAJ1453125.1 unnamed protein product [Effrenium voratum]